MKIIGIRYGFATNSSSSHSIVAGYHTDYLSDCIENRYFGWQNFVLGSPESKALYFALSALSSLFYLLANAGVRNKAAKIRAIQKAFKYFPEATRLLAIMENDILKDSEENFMWIDHQSHYVAPKLVGIDHIDIAWDFYRHLVDPFITGQWHIVGCDDDYDIPLLPQNAPYYELLTLLRENHKCIVRNEPWGWVFFDTTHGIKYRISKSGHDVDLTSLDEYTPELVDLKITNKCLQSCHYCYQDSKNDGESVPFVMLKPILEVLANIGVLEVALGGGEPLLYYDDYANSLYKLLSYTKSLNFIVNLSTRAYDLMKFPFVAETLSKLGIYGLGISVDSAQQAEDILSSIYRYNLYVAIHYIVGLPNTNVESEVSKLINVCNDKYATTLVLLGFKSTGRAKYVTPSSFDASKLTEIIMDSKTPVSIDTVLAKQIAPELSKLNIDKRLYELHEGITSKYIDAIECQVGRSSYEPETFKSFKEARHVIPNHEPFYTINSPLLINLLRNTKL